MLQVCVPLEGALYRVVRSSETGRRLVQDLGSRDVLVVPAGQPHAVLWRRSADVVSLQLCRPFITQALGVEGLSLRDTFTVRDAFISAAALQLRAALRADGRVSPAFAEAMATAIAYRVAVAGSTSGGDIRTTDRAAALSTPQLARVVEFIDEHLDEPITLARLADLLGMSTWHFMRRFKASQGVSPYAFITERRLDRAQALLATSRLSISAIALEVGLSHSHFSRTFLAGVRLSPREYRRLRGG
jgi:AraC family transcriptional regulator